MNLKTKNLKESFSILNEIIQKISSTKNIEELGKVTYEGIQKIINFDCFIKIIYYNENNNFFDYKFIVKKINYDNETYFLNHCIYSKDTLITNDSELKISIAYLPLFQDNKIIGIFSIQSNKINIFSNNEILAFIKNISSFINIMIIKFTESEKLSKEIEEKQRYEKRLKKINDKLQKISRLDTLSKLYNRRYFERLMKEFWIRAKNEKKELGFLIFDLDYFKQINDNFGHLEGDKTIFEVSKIIKNYTKDYIRFARFGGDEFVGIIYNFSKKELLDLGLKISEDLKIKKINCPNSNTGFLTLTMGISKILPTNKNSINDLFIKADKALYLGKEKGKNQITFYEE